MSSTSSLQSTDSPISKVINLKSTKNKKAPRRTFSKSFIETTLKLIRSGQLKTSEVKFEGKPVSAPTVYSWMKKKPKADKANATFVEERGLPGPSKTETSMEATLRFYKQTLIDFIERNARLEIEIRLLNHERNTSTTR